MKSLATLRTESFLRPPKPPRARVFEDERGDLLVSRAGITDVVERRGVLGPPLPGG